MMYAPSAMIEIRVDDGGSPRYKLLVNGAVLACFICHF
jgi:hypothetical protein